MATQETSWSLGVLIGVPVIVVAILIALIAAALFFRGFLRERDSTYGDAGVFLGASGICVLVVLAILGGAAWGYYPWKAEYHQWNGEAGTIATISSRILGSSDSFQQKFVVRFTDGRERSCEDTRCSLLKSGDQLSLACKRKWQYIGTDGWDCNYLDSRKAA